MIINILQEFNEKIIEMKKKEAIKLFKLFCNKNILKINDKFWKKIKKLKDKLLSEILIKLISFHINQTLNFKITKNEFIELIISNIKDKNNVLNKYIINDNIKEVEIIYNKLLNTDINNKNCIKINDNLNNCLKTKGKSDNKNDNQIDKLFQNNIEMSTTSKNKLKNNKKEEWYYLDSNSNSKSENSSKNEIKIKKFNLTDANNFEFNKKEDYLSKSKNLILTPKVKFENKILLNNNINSKIKSEYTKKMIFKIVKNKINNKKTNWKNNNIDKKVKNKNKFKNNSKSIKNIKSINIKLK